MKFIERLAVSGWISLAWVALWPAGPAVAHGAEVCAPHEQTASECTVLAHIPGPEDLVVDECFDRLIVSSQDRRRPERSGHIYAVSWPDETATDGSVVVPRKLTIRGRDRCSFHPHGIFLQAAGGCLAEGVAGTPVRLYVINHHDAADRTADRSCFPAAAADGTPSTSVETYDLYRNHLQFRQRLARPDVLDNGNDLVVRTGGEIYVTVPPRSPWAQAVELLGGRERSKVVRYDPNGDDGTRWEVVATVGRYVNGIAEVSGRLIVSSTVDGKIYEILPDEGRAEHLFTFGSGHDNLTALHTSGHVLVASHPDMRRFLQHVQSPRATSPSRVWRFGLGDTTEGKAPDKISVFCDDGSTLSGASTATCRDGYLILGQVFGGAVLRCPNTHCPKQTPSSTEETTP